jgi:hypothetical protein
MKINILMALVLISFFGCSDKKTTPVYKKHIDLAKNEKKIVEEFIPEHIRKSKIEVVKRN